MIAAGMYCKTSEEWGMRSRLALVLRGSVASIVGILACTLTAAAPASAVTVSLPTDAVINMTGQSTVVNMDIGSVTGLEAVAVSFTFSPGLITPCTSGSPGNMCISSVQRGALTAGCDAPQVNTNEPGRLTITMACSSMPVSGSGTLFQITFNGLANGTTPLTFSSLIVDMMTLIPNGCLLNEGTPSCEPSNGQIVVGPMQPTSTASTTPTATATRTNTPASTGTATRTGTATATNTSTLGPSATATATRTSSATPTITSTPVATGTATNTPIATATATGTATRTATPVPTPRINSGAVGGSTRVLGTGAPNVSAPGIEIVAETGNEVIGTGGTTAGGSFFDGANGIGLTRPLVAGERIFPRDVAHGVVGPSVVVGPQPPTAIPTLDEHGMLALGTLLALSLVWRLASALRRR
jgi:hypothetical protein